METVRPLACGQRLALVRELAAAPAVIELDGLEPKALSDGIALAQALVDRDAGDAQLPRPLCDSPVLALVLQYLRPSLFSALRTSSAAAAEAISDLPTGVSNARWTVQPLARRRRSTS